MNLQRGLLGIGLIASLGALSACSCSPSAPAASEPPRATSTSTPARTKPAGPVVIAPLTGAPAPRPQLLGRPALAVKIDNADGPGSRARPQSGITKADVVYEERVEGSVTRLLAVFHSVGSEPVGPIRSGRTTDIQIMGALQWPLFAWSGSNAIFEDRIRSGPMLDVGIAVAPSAYIRRNKSGHVAPHNLYSTTTKLWAAAPSNSKPPEPLFTYRKPGASPGAGARPVAWVNIDFGVTRGAPVDWKWDAKKRLYLRFQRGTPHVDERGTQVAASNVIIQFVGYHSSGVNDGTGTPIPEAALIGSGQCWVMTGGELVSGTWSKPALGDITTFSDANGNPIGLAPGKTWVELPVPNGAKIKA